MNTVLARLLRGEHMTIEKRVKALEVEAAFDTAAQAMGGWDELRRWAGQNQGHCKEVLLRFLPAGFFKQSNEVTLEDLVAQSQVPTHEYSDSILLQSLGYHTDKVMEYRKEAERRGLDTEFRHEQTHFERID